MKILFAENEDIFKSLKLNAVPSGCLENLIVEFFNYIGNGHYVTQDVNYARSYSITYIITRNFSN